MSINTRNIAGADTDIHAHARFSGRADVYRSFRPRYPEALLRVLAERCGLAPRIASSSYIPRPGHARYAEMRSAIQGMFALHQKNGIVRLEYICRVHIGHLE